MINFKNNEIPINDDNLNAMQEIKRVSVKTTEEIETNTNYTLTKPYLVGKNNLFVIYEGTILIKDENYIEVGTEGQESTLIQFKDWDVPIGSKLEFIYK